MEKLQLTDEKLREWIKDIHAAIKRADKELNNTNIDDLTLDDLIEYKSSIRETIYAARKIESLYPICVKYHALASHLESYEQVTERFAKGKELEKENAQRYDEMNGTMANYTIRQVEGYTKEINELLKVEPRDYAKTF